MLNKTMLLDATKDIIFVDGEIAMTSDSDAILQNIINTLLVYKGEFEKDADHGTDYESVFDNERITNDEVVEIIRDAIFQEPNVQEIESISASRNNRSIEIKFTVKLNNGDTITSEVTI